MGWEGGEEPNVMMHNTFASMPSRALRHITLLPEEIGWVGGAFETFQFLQTFEVCSGQQYKRENSSQGRILEGGYLAMRPIIEIGSREEPLPRVVTPSSTESKLNKKRPGQSTDGYNNQTPSK